jgi:hypothetical protein
MELGWMDYLPSQPKFERWDPYLILARNILLREDDDIVIVGVH